ncbi:MAG: stage III sporulation protein AC [Firmicutes bacterium]|nr:stage III sporulation protein AC [Bacillota bacterium]
MARAGNRKGREKVADVSIIIKIAGVGILISIMNMVLKQADKEEQAQLLTLAGVVIVLLMVIPLLYRLFQEVRAVFGL